jgi:Ca-activated chloride channel homolog
MKGGLVLLFTAAVWAQEPTFKTRAREVVVPVSVMTKTGKPVEDLHVEDFQVLNDGKPQLVRMVSSDSSPLPIYAVIVLQLDNGSAPALAKIKKTASLISGYITNDMGIGRSSLAAVVTVADEVRLAQNFTADPDILGDTFAKLSATGNSSRVIDGVSLACDLLAARNSAARRLIVLISESRDVESRAHFSDVVVKAQRNDVVIYTISYSAFMTAFTQKASERPQPPDQPGLYDPSNHGSANLLAIPILLAQLAKTNVAEAFAQSTGGSHQKFTTLHGLETQLIVIGSEIHNRYILTFTPPESQMPGYHELSVGIRKPEDRRIHARAGYWSGPE